MDFLSRLINDLFIVDPPDLFLIIGSSRKIMNEVAKKRSLIDASKIDGDNFKVQIGNKIFCFIRVDHLSNKKLEVIINAVDNSVKRFSTFYCVIINSKSNFLSLNTFDNVKNNYPKINFLGLNIQDEELFDQN